MTRGGAPSELAARAAFALTPKRRLGQNFLVNAGNACKIAELATTPTGGSVVEIGAGTGALTAPLLERAARVTAIERDRDLIPVLEAALGDDPKLQIVEGDAREIDLRALLSTGPRPRILAGNLPYSITGPILERTAGLADVIDRAVFLVQLEVAQRLVASPSTAAYGALTVFTRAAYGVRRAFIVRAGSFHPVPRVDSAVVVLEPRADRITEDETFRALVRGAFEKRRKMLRSAWKGVGGADAAGLVACAERVGIALDRRGEALSPEEFDAMAREMRK